MDELKKEQIAELYVLPNFRIVNTVFATCQFFILSNLEVCFFPKNVLAYSNLPRGLWEGEGKVQGSLLQNDEDKNYIDLF